MGRETFTREAYTGASARHAPDAGKRPVTERAEQEARRTGKLHKLVDPGEYGVIRPSRPRFEEQSNGTWLLTVGTPVPVETRVDTTGSMGNNVETAFRVLPTAFELISGVLPGCDLQMATGIFGDVQDTFVLCRPQFEALADRIVHQLTLMVPDKGGGDFEEDPHYGLFGAAYLTAFYINRIGLMGYDFTVSDATAHDRFDATQLVRVFGSEVFKKTAENGHQIDRHRLPSIADVVRDLQTRAHAFFLQVDGGYAEETASFWRPIFGRERVITLPTTEFLPQVQAVIIGLTEGTLSLSQVSGFLTTHGVGQSEAARIVKSVANVPIGAQAALPNFKKRPKAGDIFKNKTDVWPMTADELKALAPTAGAPAKPAAKKGWL
jgi:hypothetical protein